MNILEYDQILKEESEKLNEPLEEMVQTFSYWEYKDHQPVELKADIEQWIRIERMKRDQKEYATSQVAISLYPSQKRKLKQIRQVKKNFSLSAEVQNLIDQIYKKL